MFPLGDGRVDGAALTRDTRPRPAMRPDKQETARVDAEILRAGARPGARVSAPAEPVPFVLFRKLTSLSVVGVSFKYHVFVFGN